VTELSLNEVETLAAKAARGGGYDWGLAEEVGRAAVALARGGYDWSGALRALLAEAAGFVAPGAEGTVCPVRAAAWVNDAPPEGERVLRDVGRPIWLVAMLRGAEATTDLEAVRADVRLGPPGPRLQRGYGGQRASISRDDLDALGAYAARTYVPESDSSRRRGAGGGRVDDE